MTDDVELEYERDLPRAEIADYLERFADGLRDGGEIELTVGDETTAINPPETVEFELEIEDEPEDGGVERSVEFELEWMRTDEEPPLSGERSEDTDGTASDEPQADETSEEDDEE